MAARGDKAGGEVVDKDVHGTRMAGAWHEMVGGEADTRQAAMRALLLSKTGGTGLQKSVVPVLAS
jgi:hypothetical protein